MGPVDVDVVVSFGNRIREQQAVASIQLNRFKICFFPNTALLPCIIEIRLMHQLIASVQPSGAICMRNARGKKSSAYTTTISFIVVAAVVAQSAYQVISQKYAPKCPAYSSAVVLHFAVDRATV